MSLLNGRGAKEEDKVNPTRSEGGGEADDRTQGGVKRVL